MGNLSQLQQLGLGFAGAGVAAGAVSGFGQYESGQQQKAAYDYNAAVTLENTQAKMQTSEADYANLIGKQASSYARAGVDIASGSPLLMMIHTASQSGKEQESEYQVGTEEAALDKYYGRVAAFQGTIGGISSFISGLGKGSMQAASLLS